MIRRLPFLLLALAAGALLTLAAYGWWSGRPTATLTLVVASAATAIVAGIAGLTLVRADRERRQLRASVGAERQLSATLEQAVTVRTAELEDAQRVLQRIWWLGQQITLEMTPSRVLERFLEAVIDIVQADGGFVALLHDDQRFHVSVVAGAAASMAGARIPFGHSKIAAVARDGRPWTAPDVRAHAPDFDPATFEKLCLVMRGILIIPICRRNERIGAVVLGCRSERVFSGLDVERTEAIADLLAVTLDNAELVETLRRAESRFRTLFRAAPDAVLTVLQSGRIHEANDAVRDLTGRDPADVEGRQLIDFVAPHDRDRISAALVAASGGLPQRLEATFHEDGQPRRAVALAMTRVPEADPPSVLLLGRDITSEREMRGRLMESDRLAAVGELVAGVAHEVNNPLSSISAFAQLLLRDTDLTANQREFLEVIKAETLRASQVVRDLLAFARRSESHREPIDINEIVAHTLRLRNFQLSSNRITVDQCLAADLPTVVADARQLQQVCLNLLTNAIQAMATLGGGTLFITTRAAEGRVILEIRDTGPGIPESARAHVFEPFFTTKDEGEGTGLGLSVSYGIVADHGGSIEVADTSPAGTTFRVSLPSASANAPEHRARTSGPHTVRSALAGTRILFVDDEVALCSGMQAYGDLRGFTVVTAGSGAEALNIVRSTGVDAVVCDVRMPGMDGFAFHERLARERPGLAARTVFITGDVASQAVMQARTQPILAKPFAFDQLEEALVAAMRGAPYRGVITPQKGPSRGPEGVN